MDEIGGVAWDLDVAEALRWRVIQDHLTLMQGLEVLMSVPEQDRSKLGHNVKGSNMLANHWRRQAMLHVQETVRTLMERMCILLSLL